MKKYVALLLALVMVAGCFAGCGSKAGTDDSNSNNDTQTDLVIDLSDITIGASVMSLQHEFMANLVKGYNEFIKQTNCNIIITDGGNMEPEKQVTNVENYITQGVDGILCQCISVETMKDTLKTAMAQGIPVGIYPYDTSVGATTYFGYDEYVWGYSLGEAGAVWAYVKLDGKG